MICDLRTEGLARIRVSDRGIARCANHSRCAGRNRESSLFEGEHRDLEPLAFFADEVTFRHAHVLPRKISGVPGADAELAVKRSRGEALHRPLNYKAGHA